MTKYTIILVGQCLFFAAFGALAGDALAFKREYENRAQAKVLVQVDMQALSDIKL